MHRRSPASVPPTTSAHQGPPGRLRLGAVLLAGAGLALLPGPALAQRASQLRTERALRETDDLFRAGPPANAEASEAVFFEAGVLLRQAFFNSNTIEGFSTQLWQTKAQLRLYLSIGGAHEFFLRGNFDYRNYADGDALDGDDEKLDPAYVDAGWYRFNLNAQQRLAGDAPTDFDLTFTGGRIAVEWGSGLVYNDDLYAGQVDLSFGTTARLTALGGVTPLDVIDYDGTRPDFDNKTQRIFVGLMAEWTADPGLRPYAFVMAQRDDNKNNFAEFDIDNVAVPTKFHYDSNYAGLGARGTSYENLVWTAEGVYEWGQVESNPWEYSTGEVLPQIEDDICAWAALGSVTWLFNDPGDSSIYFHVMSGSGDGDRLNSAQTFGGNARYSTDQAFNSFGYVPTGLVLAPDVSNLVIFRLGGSTRIGTSPVSHLRLGVDGFAYMKIEDIGGASFPTDENERFVGTELDLFARWQITSDVSFDVRYGVFFPGDAIPEDQDEIRHVIFTGITYEF